MSEKHPIRPGAKIIITRREGGWGLEVKHVGDGAALSGAGQLTSFEEAVRFIRERYDLGEAHSGTS